MRSCCGEAFWFAPQEHVCAELPCSICITIALAVVLRLGCGRLVSEPGTPEVAEGEFQSSEFRVVVVI
jgi:hypothetical protein